MITVYFINKQGKSEFSYKVPLGSNFGAWTLKHGRYWGFGVMVGAEMYYYEATPDSEQLKDKYN